MVAGTGMVGMYIVYKKYRIPIPVWLNSPLKELVIKDGSIIEGLYSAGNNSASVMGHTYPGPGSTIAPAGVFSYLGALHAAQQAQNPTTLA